MYRQLWATQKKKKTRHNSRVHQDLVLEMTTRFVLVSIVQIVRFDKYPPPGVPKKKKKKKRHKEREDSLKQEVREASLFHVVDKTKPITATTNNLDSPRHIDLIGR